MADNPLKDAMSRAATTASGATTGPTRSGRVAPSRQGKKGVLFHVDPGVAKRLKMLAVEYDTTIEALGIEALGLLFERYATKGGAE